MALTSFFPMDSGEQIMTPTVNSDSVTLLPTDPIAAIIGETSLV